MADPAVAAALAALGAEAGSADDDDDDDDGLGPARAALHGPRARQLRNAFLLFKDIKTSVNVKIIY
jgi:hypothetical protein